MFIITGWAFPLCYTYDASNASGAHMVPIADSSTTEASCIALGYIWISDDTNGCDALMTSTASGGDITYPDLGDVIVAGTSDYIYWDDITFPFSRFRISLYHEK